MNVLHVTLSLGGGAGIACRRLHEALGKMGVQSEIFAAIGNQGPGVRLGGKRLWRWRAHLDRLPLRRYPGRKIFAWWSNNWVAGAGWRGLERSGADVLHVHWIGDGWVHPDRVAHTNLPVVWTLHDAWAFTGGCHYPGDCDRFTSGCGACPQLGSTNAHDLSAKNFSRKQHAWNVGRPVFVAPSRWLASQATRSVCVLGRTVEVIPNGLDVERFLPGDRAAARDALGLPEDRVALLVFASGDMNDSRKGAHLIGPALASLPENQVRQIRLLVVGDRQLPGLPEGMEVSSLGRVDDETKMAAIYTAADAHVLPTLQDNLPNTALEAIACGCPVLGFASGGLPEIVASGRNGLLTASRTVEGLAGLLSEYLTLSPEILSLLRTSAREVFLARFNARDRAADYLSLYRTLASNPK